MHDQGRHGKKKGSETWTIKLGVKKRRGNEIKIPKVREGKGTVCTVHTSIHSILLSHGNEHEKCICMFPDADRTEERTRCSIVCMDTL